MTQSAAPETLTYYVSASSGDNDNDGLSIGSPFQTISKVNGLALQPGDQVRFKCGDTWQGEQLVISQSGNESASITFDSYPEDCENKPIFSGSLPVTGWSPHAGNIYVADWPVDETQFGVNQLFRDGERLILGRWPNLNEGEAGYSFVDGHVYEGKDISDNELPGGIDWTGAMVHLKNIRWSMINREVTASSGSTLTLNKKVSCLISGWNDCIGWGYFINNHFATLDQDGEWYYDEDQGKIFLVSTSGMPENIEGSVVLDESATLRHGGIMLSDGSATAYVILDNLEVKNWFNHGIGTPGGMFGDIYHHITVRNLTIKDVDSSGVRLSSWLENPPNGRKGLRGGHHMVFENNLIDGANHFGITGYFAESIFEDNQIQNIGLIKNLGASGMGCGLSPDQCTENGDGLRIRLYDVRDSGYGNTLRNNRFERTGYNAVDVFGPENMLENNFITLACYSKADCGGVRVFGNGTLEDTNVYDVKLIENIIFDIPGNVDGCHESRPAFGMGIYIDNYSRNVEVRGNTVISTTITGILYQRSTGEILENTVYNASTGTAFSAQLSLGGSVAAATIRDNILYGLNEEAWTFYAASLSNIVTSDTNDLFHPYVDEHIAFGSSWTRYTFPAWQAYSGQETHSKTNWFLLNAGDPPLSQIFYNDTQSTKIINLGSRKYLDVDQNEVLGVFSLAPFSSRILIDNGDAGLTLLSMTPNIWQVDEATDFMLTVQGTGFTPNSVVRWNGADRPMIFVNENTLMAAIFATDVNTVAQIPVTVYDPDGNPSETPPLTFRVVEHLWPVYLPVVSR
jgi:parallel beta-helix repeat protein